ncbi:MAG: hypothetical protein LQ343_002394 [Gyalolechia ehrenbergii]|nr:MAG: hypothetical protein LQ343_002394 [Gyalolechia ehrenbergii]
MGVLVLLFSMLRNLMSFASAKCRLSEEAELTESRKGTGGGEILPILMLQKANPRPRPEPAVMEPHRTTPTRNPTISLRPPTTSPHHAPEKTPTFKPPPPHWLSGTWHVTHSSLPMWKSARNVSITYTPLPPAPSSSPSVPGEASPLPRLDDLVRYQKVGAEKWKSVEGVDTPAAEGGGGEWNWRGKGWLKIAGSRWEVLGWGDIPPAPSLPSSVEGEGETGEGAGEKNQWVVTYFAKTLFTPAGVDVYSRRKEGVGREVLEGIKGELGRCGDEGVRALVGGLFEVRRD